MSEERTKQTEVFTRIDVSKLHSALDNAMKLGTMEVCVSVCVCVCVCEEEEKERSERREKREVR